MFVNYSKTKAEFIAAGLPSTYNNSIVFIKGDANGAGSCIYTHGQYFANFAELIAALNYVKGVSVSNQNFNAAAGGGYLAFGASDPSTVAVNAGQNGITIGLTTEFVNKVVSTATNLGSSSDAANKDGSVFARIANLAALVSDLTGGSTDSIEGQIAAAISALRTEIVGSLGTDDAKTLEKINDELDGLDVKVKAIEDAGYITIAAVNSAISVLGGEDSDETDHIKVTVKTAGGEVSDVVVDDSKLVTVLGSKADLSNGKIPTSQLPDFILGQVLYGGLVSQIANANMVQISPSAGFISKFGNISSVTSNDYAKYEGVYFISNITGTFGDFELVKGDWLISTGAMWAKVDNTDAVSSVAGLNGVIAADALAAALAATTVNGALATKAEVTNVKVSASGDDLVSASNSTDGRTITIAATEALETAVANANSAYQKPSTGIAKTDLATGVQTSLGYADTAIQSVAFNNLSLNNKIMSVTTSGTKTTIAIAEGKVANDKFGIAEAKETKAYIDSLWQWEEL